MKRRRSKRLLGMTPDQIALLVGIIVVWCLVMAGGWWWMSSIVAEAYMLPESLRVTWTPSPTSTSATFTPTPSATPTPSPTPITYESLIPNGWKQFTAPGVEIWLPPAYAAQTEADRKNTFQVLEARDSTWKTVLRLKDTRSSPYFVTTTFKIVSRPLTAATLDEIFEEDLREYMQRGRMFERKPFEFQLTGYPAQRFLFDIGTTGVNLALVLYGVQIGGDVYYLVFVTPFNEMSARLPDFDSASQTFRVLTIP